MSKRKIEEVYDEKNDGDGGGAGDTKAPAANATGIGWADLPAELVRRVGLLQNDAQSLAGMERTCKSWRKVIIEGDGKVDMGGNPCLWRELALAKFPRLVSIVNVVTGTGSVSGAVLSWKAMFKSHFLAEAFSQSVGHDYEGYQPKGSWSDYITTVEFRRDDEKKVLFVASGRGFRTSSLWNQAIELDDYYNATCLGPLDSELSSRLGVDPFSEANLRSITARVVITRLSDLSVVELGSVNYDDDEGPTDEDGDLLWTGALGGNAFLPIGITDSRGGKLGYRSSDHLRMKFWLKPENGEVILSFEEREQGEETWFGIGEHEDLVYLETQCPWP